MRRSRSLEELLHHKRWAFEELVYAEKMVECNGLSSSSTKAIRYYLRKRGYPGKQSLTDVEDLLQQAKDHEAINLMLYPRRMLRYLLTLYSAGELTHTIEWIITVQRGKRSKTQFLQRRLRPKSAVEEEK